MHSRSGKIKTIIAGTITITAVIVIVFVLMKATAYSPYDESESVEAPLSASFRANIETSESSGSVENGSAENGSVGKTREELTPDDLPSRLIISKISVDAHVQHVGVNAKGNMASPTNFKDVGWFKNGALPGEVGTAVIDGHYDNGLGLKAVFYNLEKLQIGDEVKVVTKGGETLNFTVTNVEKIDYKDPNAAEKLFAKSDKPILKLVTCGGDWIPAEKTYDERIVVTAELHGRLD